MKVKEMVKIKPTQRQIDIQKLEFYGFIHFGMNTMTENEWGDGKENPRLFNPGDINVDDWIRTMKEAGMKGAIITAKHHDGFCLWPSAHTDHSVKSSPWKNGKGDLVKEFSEACQKYDMKFGVYLSPWDMHNESYGKGKDYDDFYVSQLEELLTNYGEVFSVWLDGANGEGSNGKKQSYNWERYYEVIRKYQPNAAISVCGPDVRWVGNEAGKTRKNEWSVVPASLLNAEKTAEDSQKVDDGKFSTQFTSANEDLGSRTVLENYQEGLAWYPAEVDVSIRPGWFYHEEEDEKVKDYNQLFNIYKNSVGNNALLLLNIPPNKAGEISEIDKIELKQLGDRIADLYEVNLLENSKVTFSSNPLAFSENALFNLELENSYWRSDEDDDSPFIELEFHSLTKINTVILKEFIPESQRIEKCKIYAEINNEKKLISTIEAIGYQKIIEFPEIETTKLTIEFLEFREFPTIHGLSATYL